MSNSLCCLQDLNPFAERRSTGRRAVQQVELRPSLQEVLEVRRGGGRGESQARGIQS